MKHLRNKKGFTLLEMLIVVAIIGVLAVALVPVITSAPKKARDAARKAMVNNISTALEDIVSGGGALPVDPADSDNALNDLCLSNVANGNDAAFFAITVKIPGGLPESGPGNNPTALCPSGRYYYNLLTDGYVVGVELENAANGNVATGTTAANVKAVTTIAGVNALLGTGANFYIIAR